MDDPGVGQGHPLPTLLIPLYTSDSFPSSEIYFHWATMTNEVEKKKRMAAMNPFCAISVSRAEQSCQHEQKSH